MISIVKWSIMNTSDEGEKKKKATHNSDSNEENQIHTVIDLRKKKKKNGTKIDSSIQSVYK